MERQIIPIVFATDNNYVPYCGVAISSLIQNASVDNIYEVYVLYDRISKVNALRLEGLSTNHVKVQCVCVHEYIANLKVIEHGHLTIASAFRLVIPDILPQYDKILYLDSDIVVNDDVAKMYAIDIGDNIFGAVQGYCNNVFAHYHITQTLGLKEEEFFNAGILIINASEFRKNMIKEKSFDLLSSRTDLYFMDQCALNLVCKGKVYFLESRWNYEWLFLFSENETEIELMDNPAIIHFDGPQKPWNVPNMLLADYFWKYARQSVFYEEILKAMNMKEEWESLEMLGIIKKTRNIAVYGAGNAGKRYVKKLAELNVCNIVIWVDKNYKNIKESIMPVEGIEKLYATEFDSVVIAIENRTIVDEVEAMLIENGVSKEKIVRIS